jgi:L,D-transpeptidase YcbB
LRRARAAYRAPGDPEAWQVALPPLPGRKLAQGQPYAGLDLLARRLQALGDLPEGAAVPVRFEGALVAALQAFQERHGLAPDGVLGAGTLQQLNVTPAARVRQIELAMERLRWTPLLQGPRMVVVNIPEFVLRAYEVEGERVHVRLTMKVIVGKAMNTRTPLFDEDMRFIEFSPYWNVPPSIARAETVPRLRRDPAYFTQQGFEFVTGSGQVVASLSAGNLDAVLHGGWRIRQRPGPQNALGDIKFVFPNRDNIYLHHTPAPQLFQRDRRDFSHGCIRVEDPVALAKFVLQGDPAWTGERIRDAMEKGASSTIALRQPLPVVIAYSTVIAKGGRVYFYPDLYGHDAVLDKALAARTSRAK